MSGHSGPSPESLAMMEMRDRMAEVKLPKINFSMGGSAEYCQRYFACFEVYTNRMKEEQVQRKWAPIILLNLPIPMALYSILPATFGQVIFAATFRSKCVIGMDDDVEDIDYVKTYLLFMIILAVLMIMTFAWSFLGFRYEFTPMFHLPEMPDIKIGSVELAKYSHKRIGVRKKFPLLAPFTSLPFLFTIYLILFTGFWVANLVGFLLLTPLMIRSCYDSNPEIIVFCRFICTFYWVVFFMATAHMITVVYGKDIAKAAKSAASKAKEAAKPMTDLDIADAAFSQFDTDGSDEIDSDELHLLIKQLGIEMTREELERVKDKLDADHEGKISRDEFLDWYEAEDEDEHDQEPESKAAASSDEEGSSTGSEESGR